MNETPLDWLLPSACAICGAFLPARRGAICPDCDAALPRIRDPRCRDCGTELVSCREQCTRCRNRSAPSVLPCRGGFSYDDSIAYVLARFKANGERRLAGWIGRELATLCRGYWPAAAAVLIPGSPRNVRRRGWDHMELVGAVLRGQGVATWALFRRVDGPEQKGLDREGRRAAISSSLRLGAPGLLSNEVPLVVVDDVRTTGATLEAAATLLRERGRTVVGAAVLAIR